MAQGTPTGGISAAFALDHSQPDGAFALRGLTPGHYTLRVRSDRGTAPDKGFEADLPAGTAVVDKDLVIDAGGTLIGSIVDAAGKPVPAVHVIVRPLDKMDWFALHEVRSGVDGGFRLDGMRPGAYQISAERGWTSELRKARADDQSDRVTFHDGETVKVRLVVETEDGQIRGVVLDAAGKSVPDAFVSSANEPDGPGGPSSVARTREADWWGEDKPVLTGTDGAFTLTHLAPGKYTLRAYRKGGGEAIAEHVAVGSSATLQIKPTGSIAGTARGSSGAPQAIKVTVRDPSTGYTRMVATRAVDGAALRVGEDPSAVSDASGRFTIHDAPTGNVNVRGFPLDFEHSELAYFSVPRTVATNVASPIDLGTISVMRSRIKVTEIPGELGVRFVQLPDDTPPEQHRFEVSQILPAGPAARSGLQVGDLITRCDGKDVTGGHEDRFNALVRAAPGTKIALTTKRGPTYTITLVPR